MHSCYHNEYKNSKGIGIGTGNIGILELVPPSPGVKVNIDKLGGSVLDTWHLLNIHTTPHP